MADKETTMVLKVDLECCKCYKKIKKLLDRFHEITKTDYDCKDNKVTIKVKTDNPEKFRDKLLCKGCKIITSIDIKKEKTEMEKAEEERKKAEEERKKKEEERKKAEEERKKAEEERKKAEAERKTAEEERKKKEDLNVIICLVCGRPSCGGCGGGPCDHGCKMPGQCNESSCGSCSRGRGGGTCCKGRGKSVPCCEQCCGPCYPGCGRSETCYGHGYVCGCGCGGRGYCARGCQENSQGCTIM